MSPARCYRLRVLIERWCVLNAVISLVTAAAGTKRHECSLSIALKREWWGKGIGTEITRWLINHAFGKLAVHRVTLKVLSNNDRALALYKRM